MHLFTQFIYLQVLDLLTTLAFLRSGIEEANPLVRFLVEATTSPVGGVMAVKLIALLLAAYCWRTQRQTMLVRANVFFAVVVGWNVLALAMSPGTVQSIDPMLRAVVR
ncbi:MAG: DUF5658 family protein [Bryobacteraceae bacterium]